jgi:putative peptidoglycan lipid II flippase
MTQRTRHLLQSTVIVMLLYGLNKATGFLRVILVGREFGTGADADAFTAANQLPELFYVLVAGGALAAALIPVYTRWLHDESGRARESAELANTVLTLVLLVLIAICGLAALFAPQLVRVVLVPDYSPQQQALTADLMRIILLNTIIFGVSGVFSSLLNAHQHFILPALAPIALDLGYFIGLFLLVPTFGIFGLAWGTVLGALLHVSIQVPGLIRHRLRLRPQLNLRLEGVQEVIRLMGPRIVMLGAIQAADIIIIRAASSLPEGTVSAYFYAFTLMQLPETLFGTAIALVVFPTMAEMYNAGNRDGLKRVALTALRVIWLLTIPAAVALVLLGQPAITLILERGAFDAASTAIVYAILVVFSVRVVSEATLEIVARLFYARHNTFTPMLAYLGWFVVNGGLVLLLVQRMGAAGIALASTVAFTALAALLFVLNWRELNGLRGYGLGAVWLRAIPAAAVMAGAIGVIGRFLTDPLPFLALSLLVGGGLYLLVYLLLGGKEPADLLRLLRRQPATSQP